MHVLLLLADPDRGSLTHELAGRARSGLEAAGHDVVVVDLHDVGFRAEMSTAERDAYHGGEPVVSGEVAVQAAAVTTADCLIACYPTTASGLPAILKGWFERVLVPGVGFVFDDEGRVRPGLTNLRHIVGIATYDEPRWKVAARNDNGRRTLTRALRMSCGWQTRTHWYGLYRAGARPAGAIREFADHVERQLADLT